MGYYIISCLLLLGLKGHLVSGVVSVYFDQTCNISVTTTTSVKLLSSTALHYDPNTACYLHVSVGAGQTVLLVNRYFELEAEVFGACVDFVNIHDGSSTAAATLNASPLCYKAASSNYTSSGQDMTVYFETDSTGQWLGFEFMLVAITTGTCSSTQFSCNTSVCIDASLQCNIYNECGDSSDEDGCTYASPPGISMDENTGLAVGLSVGLFLTVLIAVVIGYFCWRYNRWRLFMKRPITARQVVLDETNFNTTYPVTKLYYQERYQGSYHNPEAPTPAAYTTKTVITTNSGTTNEAFVPE